MSTKSQRKAEIKLTVVDFNYYVSDQTVFLYDPTDGSQPFKIGSYKRRPDHTYTYKAKSVVINSLGTESQASFMEEACAIEWIKEQFIESLNTCLSINDTNKQETE